MKIIEVENYKELSEVAAKLLTEQIEKKPNSVLGLATGETTRGMYRELVKLFKKGLDFSNVRTFNLDEYCHIKKSNRNSFYYSMWKIFFSKINIKKKNVHILNCEAKDYVDECNHYSKLLGENPRDIQILGIGVNGHVGFNEPGSKFNSKSRMINLTESTIKRNSRHFDYKSRIPKNALTMGLSEIMKARKIILLASGKAKRNIIRELLKTRPTEKIPASILKKHKNAIIIVDKAALGKV